MSYHTGLCIKTVKLAYVAHPQRGSVYPLGDLVVGGQLIWKGINSLMLQLLGEPIWVLKTYEYAWE